MDELERAINALKIVQETQPQHQPGEAIQPSVHQPGPVVQQPDIQPPPAHSLCSKMKLKYPTWSGKVEEYDAWRVGVEATQLIDERPDQAVILDTFNNLPAEAKTNVIPWIQRQMELTDGWAFFAWLEHLDDTFKDKDAAQKAADKVTAVRQGEAQTFASFRRCFDNLCARASNLGPNDASKIAQLKRRAFAPYLRDAVKVQRGLSRTNYAQFVQEVQSLADELEADPSFATSKGSKTEWFQTFDADNKSLTPIGQTPSENGPKPGSLDKDGDTNMGINTLSIPEIARAVVAALQGQQVGQIPRSHTRGQDQDNRPRAPAVSDAVINQRKTAGACIRCGNTPSHRFSQCAYKAPLPGMARPARPGVNFLQQEQEGEDPKN